MEAVKITLRGQFYDSQIYSGRLYLWTLDSQIIIIDWDKLIEDAIPDPNLKIAMHCAFTNSEYLYGDTWKIFSDDNDIRGIILKKLSELSRRHIETKSLRKYIISTARNYFPFPHAASDIYHSNLLVASKSGVRYTQISNKEIVRPQMLTDIPTLSISPKNFLISLACGEEGVVEINPRQNLRNLEEAKQLDYRFSSARQIINIETNNVHWMYNSVFASGNDSKAGIAKYAPPPSKRAKEEEKIRFYTDPQIIETSIIDEEALMYDINGPNLYNMRQNQFNDDIVSWGIDDKICAASSGILNTYFYRPYSSSSSQIDFIASFSLSKIMGDVVRGSSTTFGYIVEMDEGLQIILSDGSSEEIMGEPVNWRVFNRSKNYSNQIHIIYDDRIDIISYNESIKSQMYMRRIGLSHTLETSNKSRSLS